jgi:hypothetical protein
MSAVTPSRMRIVEFDMAARDDLEDALHEVRNLTSTLAGMLGDYQRGAVTLEAEGLSGVFHMAWRRSEEAIGALNRLTGVTLG